MADVLPERYGKYVLLRRIAVGGMAEIFRAKAIGAEGFERDIAIKRIVPSYTADESFVQMFKDEANIAAKLTHANIVQIFDFDLHGGTYYIAMEFVEGKDLKQIADQLLRSGTPLSPLLITKVIIDICSGLHYAHTKTDRGQPLNIVHRDVSPHNVMLSFNGEAKLMDFGIAKARQRFTQTQAGMVKGKCAYMSPEQVRGGDLDGRSDLFSLAVVMWELLTRKRLFAGDTDYVTLTNVIKAEVPPPRSINPEVPEELERILLKALQGERDARHCSVAEFQRELQRFFYTEAGAHEVSVQDFMQTLFTASIQALQTELAEERQLFQEHLAALEAQGVHPQDWSGFKPAVATGTHVPPTPITPAPTGTAGGSQPAGSLGAILPREDSDSAASTIPLADLQRQLKERLEESDEVDPEPGPPEKGSPPATTSHVQKDEDGPPATAAMAAISDSLPEHRPGSETRPEYSGVRRTSNRILVPLMGLLALGVGLTAFFIARSVRESAAPPEPVPAFKPAEHASEPDLVPTPVITPAITPAITPDIVEEQLKGSVTVKAPAPVPVALTIDGRARGSSPVQIEGEPGQMVHIEAVAEGYLPHAETVTIERDHPISLQLQRRAPLELKVTPAAAEVSLNDRVLPPSESGEYAIGEFGEGDSVVIEATAPRHRRERVSVELPHDDLIELTLKPIRVAPRPRQARGVVRLNARPWADIFFQGRKLGRTPYEGRLPVGDHVLVFRRGDLSERVRITVKEKGETIRVVNMEREPKSN